MKKTLTLIAAILLLAGCGQKDNSPMVHELDGDEIQLLAPDLKGGSSVMEALWQRRSDREYSDQDLSLRELSNLLWAATGVNRPEDGRRTNPTAINKQEISVYAFLPQGVYLYEHASHSLKKMAEGDHRDLVAGFQNFAKEAPLSLVIVEDLSKFGERAEQMSFLAHADAGYVSQNINLFCAAYSLATVPRASMDHEAISALLGLSPLQRPILNNPVGHRR